LQSVFPIRQFPGGALHDVLLLSTEKRPGMFWRLRSSICVVPSI
jgi:hypothetical protein